MSESQKHLRFDITGMACAACSARLERVLSMLEGVQSASVQLASATADIIPDMAHSKSPACDELSRRIIDKTKAIGFGASLVRSDEDELIAWEAKQETARIQVQKQLKRLYPESVLALCILYISMGNMLGLPLPSFLEPAEHPFAFALTQCFLAIPVLWMGRHFYIQGIPKLFSGAPNMDTLVSMGTGTAFLYSVWSLVEIALSIFPSNNIALAHHFAMDLYFESSAVLITLISFGKYLEASSRIKLTDAIGGLMKLSPQTALRIASDDTKNIQELIAHGAVSEIPLAEVCVGDLLQVRPGLRVPVDGTVVFGTSSIDASMLTGESMPVSVEVGSSITGGTMNIDGVLVMRAEKIGSDTTLSCMVRMVREAQDSKAPIARLADRISLYFVPSVMSIATLSGLAWYILGAVPFTDALRIFVAVMVVACPCALGLATPLSIMVATGRGARLGVLVKNGAALEAAGRVNTLLFDKTGTLTIGHPQITHIERLNGTDENMLLAYVASLEATSSHPLARAIMDKASEHNIKPLPVEQIKILHGLGLSGVICADKDSAPVKIHFGNRRFMEESNINLYAFTDSSTLQSGIETFTENGETVLFLSVNNELVALFAVADPIRPEAPSVIEELKKLGVEIMLLSGDFSKTAQAVGKIACIDKVIAEVKPEDKAHVVAQLQKEGRVVGMVGDGINDAPALASANLGLAMSSGVDIAVDAGDIVLLCDNKGGIGRGLSSVITSIKLGRATLTNIRENLIWAFGYNLLCLPVAAGLLKVFGGPSMSPMFAGLAMAMSSVSVVLNAARLKNFKE